ncbi:MAG TPA: hypothetical protein VMW11_05160 [Candidatus Dormibacteraeota bacterium]|nr:hypothetical protein [Candidatus Dormibacteraeota bacterium]
MSRYMWSLVARRNRPAGADSPASARARWDRAERRWVERDPRHKSAGA